MADTSPSIDALIATGGRTNANFNFGELNDAFYKGQEAARKQADWKYTDQLRHIFSDENGGIPRDAAGNFDANKGFERVVAAGGAPAIEAAASLANAGLQQDRIRNSPLVIDAISGRAPGGATNIPPSPSRNVIATEPPLPGAGGVRPAVGPSANGGYKGGDNGSTSLISILTAQGVPESAIGTVAASISHQLGGVDANAPLDLNDPRVRNVLVPAVREARRQLGPATSQPAVSPAAQSASSPSPGAVLPSPQAAPAATLPAGAPGSSPAPVRDNTLGGLIPPGYEPGPYLQRLQAIAASGRVLPDQQKVLDAKIAAITAALQPTAEMKNAAAAGMPMSDYLGRNDDATTARDVLTKSILPKLDKSQEAATAARDDIQAIHRAREQLDAPGGIFSGAAADTRLKVAKLAEYLGVPNVDKIANTEAFGAAIGSRVLTLVKGLGSGTGISNADREYAAQMAGGNVRLDEKSIRKILDIGERAARARIAQHNAFTARTIKSSDALKGLSPVYTVDAPGEYQAPPAGVPKAGAVVSGFRFKGGDPSNQRNWQKVK
jgi:hypothetical protein